MNVEIFKIILGKTDYTDAQLEVLLKMACSKAVNHFFWREDDIPTEDEKENFIDRYEYEIYDLAKTIVDTASQNGLKEFSELGVTRVWQSSDSKSLESSLSAIPVKTYVW